MSNKARVEIVVLWRGELTRAAEALDQAKRMMCESDRTPGSEEMRAALAKAFDLAWYALRDLAGPGVPVLVDERQLSFSAVIRPKSAEGDKQKPAPEQS